MNPEFFKLQMARLQTRFGVNAFDNEFVKLVWDECREMSDPYFKKTVDRFIGHKSWMQPPLLAEFREAALAEIKHGLKTDVMTAARCFGFETRKTLREVIGFDNVADAMKAARRRLLQGGKVGS